MLQLLPFPEWCANIGTGRQHKEKESNKMRFSQIFLTMGYNTVVKVDKVTEIKSTESGNTMDAEYIGAFKRFDRIPKEIWSARVCTFFAESEDELLVVIERDNDDKN